MNRMLFALVNNEPEVLMRVTALLRRIGFTMRSISMVEATNPSLAHLTIMTEEHQSMDQAINQMKKFVDVHEVRKIESMPVVEREWDAMKNKAQEMHLFELQNVIDKEGVGFQFERNDLLAVYPKTAVKFNI